MRLKWMPSPAAHDFQNAPCFSQIGRQLQGRGRSAVGFSWRSVAFVSTPHRVATARRAAFVAFFPPRAESARELGERDAAKLRTSSLFRGVSAFVFSSRRRFSTPPLTHFGPPTQGRAQVVFTLGAGDYVKSRRAGIDIDFIIENIAHRRQKRETTSGLS